MRKQTSEGWDFVILGIGLIVIAFIGLALAQGGGGAPVGRNFILTYFGIPIGTVALIIGAIKLVRQQK